MNEPGLIAFGRCWSCHRTFTFHPDLVPSIPIDPDTDSPLDVDRQGKPREFTAKDYLRSVKQPVCRDCVTAANAKREAEGRPRIEVLPGAYPDE